MGRLADARGPIFVGALIALLIALSVWIPQNALTGKVVQDPCADGTCLELCELDGGTCSREGTVCCFTHWETGVCDYSANCERVREYSLFQPLELYRDTIQNPPPPERDWGRFLFPLLLTVACVAFLVRQWRAGARRV
jgi:hypothetical protein